MKPSFFEYNNIAADACQILAVAEIQYSDENSPYHNAIRAQQCRTLRVTLGGIILEAGQQLQNNAGSIQEIEEKAIESLKMPLSELIKKMPVINAEMKVAANGNARISFLAKPLFSDKTEWGVFNIFRLQSNLALLVAQERELAPRPYNYATGKIVTNIFMQPYSAEECETRANKKLAEMIWNRKRQSMDMEDAEIPPAVNLITDETTDAQAPSVSGSGL